MPLINLTVSISYDFFGLVIENNTSDFLFWLKLEFCFTNKIWTENIPAYV